MKRILKSRRGAAIEGVLFFMVVVFALSMLLLAAVTAMGYRNLATERRLDTYRELEQIGVYFVANDARLTEAMDGYTDIDASDDILHLQRNGKTVLYIERSGTQATEWYYGDPPQQQ